MNEADLQKGVIDAAELRSSGGCITSAIAARYCKRILPPASRTLCLRMGIGGMRSSN